MSISYEEFIGKPKRNQDFALTLRGLRNQVKSIHLDDNLVKMLTLTSMKIRIEIDRFNQPAISILDEKTDERLGSVPDLQRMADFSKFVKEQEKIEDDISLLQGIEELTLAKYKELQKENPRFGLKKLTPVQVGLLRELSGKMSYVKANLKHLKEKGFLRDQDLSVKMIAEHYESWCNLILDSISAFVGDVLLGSIKAKGLEDHIFHNNVPQFVYKWFTRRSFSTVTDLRRVIFPGNTASGITLTIKEWASTDMIRFNQCILANSGFVVRMLRASNLPALVGIKNVGPFVWKIYDSLPPKALEMLDRPVLVVPLFFSALYLLQPGALGRSPRFTDWNLSKDPCCLPTALAETYVRTITLHGLYESQRGLLWDPLFKGTSYTVPRDLSVTRNFFNVTLEASKSLDVVQRLQTFTNGISSSGRYLVANLMRISLGLGTESQISTLIATVAQFGTSKDRTWDRSSSGLWLGMDPDMTAGYKEHGRIKTPVAMDRTLKHVTDLNTEDQVKELSEFHAKVGLRKTSALRKEGEYKDHNPAILALSPRARTALETLTKQGKLSSVLVEGVAHWLRTFPAAALQKAALLQVLAHYDLDDEHAALSEDERENLPACHVEDDF